MEWLCRSYWRPVHESIRRRGHSPEDALDLTQGFFAGLIEKEKLENVDPARGRFRSWVLGALQHFLLNNARRARTQKRHAGTAAFSLEAMLADGAACEPVDDSLTPDKAFDRRWALTVLDEAVRLVCEEYTRRGAADQFARLKPFLMAGSSAGEYEAVARELGTTTNHVAVAVKRLRERFRDRVRAVVAETVADPSEVDGEMGELFAALRG